LKSLLNVAENRLTRWNPIFAIKPHNTNVLLEYIGFIDIFTENSAAAAVPNFILRPR